jgi:hypothetical protein
VPYERIDPVDPSRRGAIDAVRPIVLTPVEREAERRRREQAREERRRREQAAATASGEPSEGSQTAAQTQERPRLDVRG